MGTISASVAQLNPKSNAYHQDSRKTSDRLREGIKSNEIKETRPQKDLSVVLSNNTVEWEREEKNHIEEVI